MVKIFLASDGLIDTMKSVIHNRQSAIGNRHSSFIIHHSSFSSTSFTLIEIMVVISIVAILAAFLFPVVLGARKRFKQRQVIAESHNIVMAIKTYRNEYGKWPCQTQSAADTTYVTNNYLVISKLMGDNPKNKIFLSIQTNMLDSLGNFVDPWGTPYLICMDEHDNIILDIEVPFGSYSNKFQDPPISITFEIHTNAPQITAGVASFGEVSDGMFVSNSLEYRSWTEIE